MKMKIDLHPLIDERGRCCIQLSEFSYAAYPVQINHVFRCVLAAANPPNESHHRWRNGLGRRISQWLRWLCGKPTAAPAADNLSLEQAAP